MALTPPRGFTLAPLAVFPLPDQVRLAKDAEALGYGAAWVAEAAGAEAGVVLGAIAQATSRIALGTGVLALQVRSVPLLGMLGASVQGLVPERDVWLGFGISSQVVAGRWHGRPYGERPLAEVRDAVALLRAVLSGDKVNHDGAAGRITGFRLGVRLGARRPRIVVGALNAGMLGLAGEVADGVLLNYLPASHVAASVARVRAGEAKAGRPVGACRVFVYAHAGVGDPDRSLPYARRDLMAYASVPSYARSFRESGFGVDVDTALEHWERGDRDGAATALSPAMCQAIDFTGTETEVARFLSAYEVAGADEVIVFPLPWAEDRAAGVRATLLAAAPG